MWSLFLQTPLNSHVFSIILFDVTLDVTINQTERVVCRSGSEDWTFPDVPLRRPVTVEIHDRTNVKTNYFFSFRSWKFTRKNQVFAGVSEFWVHMLLLLWKPGWKPMMSKDVITSQKWGWNLNNWSKPNWWGKQTHDQTSAWGPARTSQRASEENFCFGFIFGNASLTDVEIDLHKWRKMFWIFYRFSNI